MNAPNFSRPDRDAPDVPPVTAYTIAQVRRYDDNFADRIEGAWRAMQTQPEKLLSERRK